MLVATVATQRGEEQYRIARSPGASRYAPDGYVIERRTAPADWCPVSNFVHHSVTTAAIELYRVLLGQPGVTVDPRAPWPFNRVEQAGLFGDEDTSLRTVPQAAGQASLF